jgi:hypothetical protein
VVVVCLESRMVAGRAAARACITETSSHTVRWLPPSVAVLRLEEMRTVGVATYLSLALRAGTCLTL